MYEKGFMMKRQSDKQAQGEAANQVTSNCSLPSQPRYLLVAWILLLLLGALFLFGSLLPGALPGQPSLAGSLASFLSFLSLCLPPFFFYQHLTNAAVKPNER